MKLEANVQTIGIGLVVGALALYLLYSTLVAGNDKKPAGPKSGLDPQNYQRYPLIKKTNVTHNTRLFRFALQTPTTVLGLPIGRHISFKFGEGENEVRRPYTPVSSDDDLGHFDMVIKVYEKGQMSQHLDHLKIGDAIEARGPMGRIEYDRPGHFSILQRKDEYQSLPCKHIGMIAGGTGITPMLQIIRHIVKNPQDKTRVTLIFGNVSIDDILLRDELDAIVADHPNFIVYYTLDKAPEEWTQGRGYVTREMIAANLPPPSDDVVVLNCGPPPMMKGCVKTLEEMGYNPERVIKF